VVGAPNPPVRLFGWELRLERQARLFLVVALAGTLGGLVGLFSNQAAEWLKRIFEQVFTTAPKGKDAAVEVTAFDPVEGAAGTLVVVQGTGFTGVQTVTFGGVEATGVTQATDTELRVVVPDGARTGPITVTSPAGTGTSTRAFTVLPPAGEEPAAPAGGVVAAERGGG
jgi:IPT/TIG domain